MFETAVRFVLRSALLVVIAAGGARSAGAQSGNVFFIRAEEAPVWHQAPEVIHESIAVDVVAGIGGQVVKGAPYSAVAVTRVERTLSDGNRIVREVRSPVHRDGQGRTRREPTLAPHGPAAGGDFDVPERIVIDDPVADLSWVLDPERKTATRRPRTKLRFVSESADHAGHDVTVAGGTWVPREPGGEPPPPADAMVRVERLVEEPSSDADVREEQLGPRRVAGVDVVGTRATRTIPAGAIGNERDISVITERWYSEELQLDVLRTQTDPRFGTTTYELQDLKVGEPDPALFEIPADYRVAEEEPLNFFVERE
jgi:hypothetical protein